MQDTNNPKMRKRLGIKYLPSEDRFIAKGVSEKNELKRTN